MDNLGAEVRYSVPLALYKGKLFLIPLKIGLIGIKYIFTHHNIYALGAPTFVVLIIVSH